MENPPNDRIKPSKWKQGRLPALYNQADKIGFFFREKLRRVICS